MSDPPIIPWLRLALAPEIGPVLAHRLLDRFGSAEAVFESSIESLSETGGLGPVRLASLLASATRERALREAERAADHEVRLVSLDSRDYPENLRRVGNPPLLLYVRGELVAEDRLALAVVGPRKPSDYGRLMTSTLAPPICARGITIVSGMAFGIDAEAHRAAIDSGGRTIAVLAQGLDTAIFPSANRHLARRIVDEERGALISIFPLGSKPEPPLFPQRNEIIAGLALGVLIVEAGEESGALITATAAADMGRPVMACPGDATRKSSRGSNRLIAEGASLIQNSDDILAAIAAELLDARGSLNLPMTPPPPNDPTSAFGAARINVAKAATADPLESKLRDMLSEDLRTIDFLIEGCADSGFTQSEVVQKLLMLELNGALRQLPGRIYCLTA